MVDNFDSRYCLLLICGEFMLEVPSRFDVKPRTIQGHQSRIGGFLCRVGSTSSDDEGSFKRLDGITGKASLLIGGEPQSKSEHSDDKGRGSTDIVSVPINPVSHDREGGIAFFVTLVFFGVLFAVAWLIMG
jgi:hypothetical protein